MREDEERRSLRPRDSSENGLKINFMKVIGSSRPELPKLKNFRTKKILKVKYSATCGLKFQKAFKNNKARAQPANLCHRDWSI